MTRRRVAPGKHNRGEGDEANTPAGAGQRGWSMSKVGASEACADAARSYRPAKMQMESFVSDPCSIRGSSHRMGGALWGLAIAAAGVACAAKLLAPARLTSSAPETKVVIRERCTVEPGDNVAAAIDEMAGQILAPDALLDALRQSDMTLAGDKALAVAAEALRGRLRVDVSPGAVRQPWTISIRSAAPEDAAAINALADEYRRRRQAATAAEQVEAWRVAAYATDRARQAAEQSRVALDRKIERLVRLAAENRSRPASPPETASSVPTKSQHGNDEALQQFAELERRVAELDAERAALLERLLPAHPEVQSLEADLTAARAELNAAQAELPAPPSAPTTISQPNEAPPSDIANSEDAIIKSLADLSAKRKSFSRALARCNQLMAAERLLAEQAIGQDPNISITPAANPAGERAAIDWPAIAMVGLFGVLVGGLLSRPRTNSPDVFRDSDELESALGVPLVGVLDS